jgi:deazaflavin-dependent oxidoreductase (nitroreductase family)
VPVRDNPGEAATVIRDHSMPTSDQRGPAADSPGDRLRLRIGAAIFRLIGPLVRGVIRAGLPAGPNVLLTVRGRRTGRPRTVPVAMFESGGKSYVQASFGDVNWVRNLRASGEAVVTRNRQSRRYQVVELEPEVAGPLLRDALAPFHRSRLVRPILGPNLRPPAAILLGYRFRIDETTAEYMGEATRHPLFELRERAERNGSG